MSRLAHGPVLKELDFGAVLRVAQEMASVWEKGFAERMYEEHSSGARGGGWYLTHHPVINPRKPGKTRIVFDCAATYRGESLDSQTLPGPDLNNKLLGVMLRFRQGKVAVSADIGSIFYQVKVDKRDRNASRFLWWKERGEQATAVLSYYNPSGSVQELPKAVRALLGLGQVVKNSCVVNTVH